MKTLFILLALFVICLLPSYYKVEALSGLSCPVFIREDPPCFKYGNSDAVFIGTATQVTKIDWDGTPPVYWNQYKQVNARLSIEEVFKGIEGNEVTIEMKDCPYFFKEGERYLVYARRKPDGKLKQDNNSMTRPVSQVKEDIEYIRALKDTQPLGTIKGGIMRNVNSFKPRLLIRDPKNYPPEPMPGIKIVIQSAQHKFETVTTDKGAFEFTDVPIGNYRVQTTIPSNLWMDGLRGDIKVTGHGCFYAGYHISPRGQISGRVLDSEGLPVPGVRVYFFSTEGVTDEVLEDIKKLKMENWGIPSLDTDNEGRYKIQVLPKGNYIIAVNLLRDTRKSKEDSKQYPRTFYPGVPTFSQATVISLGEGEVKQNLDIKLPPETIP